MLVERGVKTGLSDEAERFEADMGPFADHQMIVHGDAERLGALHNLTGHVDVRLAGRRVTGRVVVNQDEGSSARFTTSRG